MLARIDLSDAELDKMSGELAIILQSVARVSELATDDVPPTSHPLPLTNVTRPDVVRPSLSAEEVCTRMKPRPLSSSRPPTSAPAASAASNALYAAPGSPWPRSLANVGICA